MIVVGIVATYGKVYHMYHMMGNVGSRGSNEKRVSANVQQLVHEMMTQG